MSHEPVSIAVVEDDPIMGESLTQCLELEGYTIEWWRSGMEAVAGIRTSAPDLVICDIRLPDMSGEDVFRRIAADFAAPPFLFMTAFGQIDQAVALMRAGAGDYISKPFEIDDLLARARALVLRRGPATKGVLGPSQSMRAIEALLRRIARHPSPVLFTGETGVGKEICARFLHTMATSDEPFIAVNCAAIPDSLLESEVFGHEKGAFTGANARHVGYAERARRGTLFLDEVAELPLTLQAKLLRLVEDRSFYRLGGETSIAFAARVMCASNRDLEAEVAGGRFRADLHYRINVVTIDVPPLRERREDIPVLMQRLFAGLTENVETPLRAISSLAEEAAVAYAWPGNVRELRNRLERAIALASGKWLMPGDLFPERRRPPASDGEGVLRLSAARDAAERRAIQHALRETQGQIQEAAKLLGISRTTLWDRMRRFGVDAATSL